MGENTKYWLVFLLVFSNWANFPSTSGFTLNTNDTAKREGTFYLSTRRPPPRFCVEGGPMALNPGIAASHDHPSYWASSFLETIVGLLGSSWVLLTWGSLAKIAQAIKIQNENTCSNHTSAYSTQTLLKPPNYTSVTLRGHKSTELNGKGRDIFRVSSVPIIISFPFALLKRSSSSLSN